MRYCARMRQRLLMILKPNPIAHVDIAAAERAFRKYSASLNGGPVICSPMTVPRGNRPSSMLAIFI
jgi:hypothetical protein